MLELLVLEAQQLPAMAESRVPERQVREITCMLGDGLRAPVLRGGLV